MIDRAKISDAVTDCLHRCYESSSMLRTLAEYVQELEQNPEWKGYEIDVVKFRVMRVLNRIASDASEIETISTYRRYES